MLMGHDYFDSMNPVSYALIVMLRTNVELIDNNYTNTRHADAAFEDNDSWDLDFQM